MLTEQDRKIILIALKYYKKETMPDGFEELVYDKKHLKDVSDLIVRLENKQSEKGD